MYTSIVSKRKSMKTINRTMADDEYSKMKCCRTEKCLNAM